MLNRLGKVVILGAIEVIIDTSKKMNTKLANTAALKIHKGLPYDEFVRIYSTVPRLTVDVLIKTKDGVLLTKRAIPPSEGYWYIPGGTVLIDEKVEDAVKRVAKEELGLDVSVVKLIDVIDWFDTKHAVGRPVSLLYLVNVEENDIQNVKLDHQASDYGFFKKIPEKTMEEHKEVLRKILNNNKNKFLELKIS